MSTLCLYRRKMWANDHATPRFRAALLEAEARSEAEVEDRGQPRRAISSRRRCRPVTWDAIRPRAWAAAGVEVAPSPEVSSKVRLVAAEAVAKPRGLRAAVNLKRNRLKCPHRQPRKSESGPIYLVAAQLVYELPSSISSSDRNECNGKNHHIFAA